MRGAQAYLIGMALLGASACDQLQQLTEPREYTGAYAIIEVDRAALVREQLDGVSDQMAVALRGASVRYNGRGVSGDAAIIRLVDVADLPKTREAISRISTIAITEQSDGLIEARLSDATTSALAEQAALQSVEVLERRVDAMGGRASVEPYGEGRLIIRTNEAALPQSVRSAIGQQGRLTFHMVRDVPADYAALGRVPAGTMLAPPYFEGQAEIVEQRPSFTGERLLRANPSTDPQTSEFVLSFTLDDRGRSAFCRITRGHVGERFAILLDGRVLTAPVINEPICGGSGQISGNFTAQSANELAIMLRAGSLPAPVKLVEEGVGQPAP